MNRRPHIFFKRGAWVCMRRGGIPGVGMSARDAYANWRFQCMVQRA
jgi:hypothetical protein